MKIHFRYEALDSQEQRVARFLGRIHHPLTMASLGGQPDFVPTICTYRAYFSLPETDPFSGGYKAVLEPYRIDPMNAAAAQTPTCVSQQIYTASQQGDPPPSSCGTQRPGSPRIGTQAAYPYSTLSGITQGGWDDHPASWTRA